ncbi:MAG: hypothetical protein AAFR01_05485, partial [Pseudomonadota bacterium]
MRVPSSLRRQAAALLLVLLPFGVFGEEVSAQDTQPQENTGEVIKTVTNVASAQWEFFGTAASTTSNEVTFDVTLPPPEITALRPALSGPTELNFRAPFCQAVGRPGASVDPSAVPSAATAPAMNMMAEITNTVRIGQTLLFEVQALAANQDFNAIDMLTVDLVTSTGDIETETIFETGENTGIFVGQIETMPVPFGLFENDCRLSVADGATVDIIARIEGENDVLVQAEVDVLADPFGTVFDSETGEPVNGARVTLVDALTGQPATVFAEDGVTSWPSSVISGENIVDGAGRIIEMGPGEFWFPLTFLGTYRLEIEPPEPFTAPSVVQPEDLEGLLRRDGRPFFVREGSYGESFTLVDETPVQIDIPVDQPGVDIGITKTASRDRVVPGDVVFYTINVRNTQGDRPKRNVTVTDTPSRFLRLRPDTVRINGAEAPERIAFAPDGSTLTVDLGTLAGGESARITYATSVLPDAPPGRALNDAVVTDLLQRTSRAQAAVDIERETIADRMTIIGRVTAGACSLDDPRPGIPGVRVMLEDGSFAITDADGRYHFEGVVPGTHVVAVSRMTMPEGAELVDCHRGTRNAGSKSSRFVIGQGGSLVVADFHATVPEGWLGAVEDKAETTPNGSIARAVEEIASANDLSGGAETIGQGPVQIGASRLSSGASTSIRIGSTGATAVKVGSSSGTAIRLGSDSANSASAPAASPGGTAASTPGAAATSGAAAIAAPLAQNITDWIALGDGADGWLAPSLEENPRAPAVKVAIRHRKGQSIALRVDGKPVDPLAFDGVLQSGRGSKYAVSTWRGVPLVNERTVLEADIINSFGGINQTITREVFFTSVPTKVELVPELSNLVADGRTRPVVAIKVLDRNGRPLREGISGEFSLNSPYESAEQLDRQQLNQLTGINAGRARWVVEGNEGIARIELAPTMVSGSLRLNFTFADRDVTRQQELEAWIEPGDIEWTIVGLAEGTVGARSVAENMERD